MRCASMRDNKNIHYTTAIDTVVILQPQRFQLLVVEGLNIPERNNMKNHKLLFDRRIIVVVIMLLCISIILAAESSTTNLSTVTSNKDANTPIEADSKISAVLPTYTQKQSDIYVSLTGNDSSSGSISAPFRTLERARDELYHLKTTNRLPKGGITVWIREGTYKRTESFELLADDSGTVQCPIVYSAFPGEQVRIIGATILDQSKSEVVTSKDAVWSRIDTNARGSVRSINLKALGINNFGTMNEWANDSSGMAALELFIGNAKMTLARWPDKNENYQNNQGNPQSISLIGETSPNVSGEYQVYGIQDGVNAYKRSELLNGVQYYLKRLTWTHSGKTYTAWFLTDSLSTTYPSGGDWWYSYGESIGLLQPEGVASGTLSVGSNEGYFDGFVKVAGVSSSEKFSYLGSRPDRWLTADDVWLNGYWKYTYKSAHVKVKQIDKKNKSITLTESVPTGIATGQPWYAENILEELTTPGEWYLDRKTGILYYWQPENSNGKEMAVSTLSDDLVRMSGTKNVVFQNITFEMTRAAALKIINCESITVSHCLIRNIGMEGIVAGGTDIHIDNSEITLVGDRAIELSGGNRKLLQNSGNIVSNCMIHDYAMWNLTNNPAVWMGGAGHTIANNEIYNAPHYAMIYFGNNMTIENNEIYNVCKFASDAGAIYTGRNWGYRGNIVRYNFIHDINTNFEGYGVHGIYLDDCVSGNDVYGNIMLRIQNAAIFIGGGRDHNIQSNIIVDCGIALYMDDRGKRRINNQPNDIWNLIHTLADDDVDYQSATWKTQYPELAAIPSEWSKLIDKNSSWLLPENNVFNQNIGYNNKRWIVEDASLRLLNKNVAGVSNIQNIDPLFVNISELNLNLQGNSPALAMKGIESIQFDNIGIVTKSNSREWVLDGSQTDWSIPYYQQAHHNRLVSDYMLMRSTQNMTREEFVTLLTQVYEKKTGKTLATGTNPFLDTANVQVLKAYHAGVTKGIRADLFKPKAPITRQDCAVILQKFMYLIEPKLKTSAVGTHQFADQKNISSYALEAIQFSYQIGILKGIEGNQIAPLDFVTREQAITLATRIYAE